MLEHTARFTLPAAFALLPAPMQSPAAAALLLAIGLQESRFQERQQLGGSALGFWQFEVNGVRGVLDHERTHVAIASALHAMRYDHTLSAGELHPILEHNDVIAACFARCLLWTSPQPLPDVRHALNGWDLYRQTWRPGRPRRSTWNNHYLIGWQTVQPDVGPNPRKA
jgi:hypothetical protein